MIGNNLSSSFLETSLSFCFALISPVVTLSILFPALITFNSNSSVPSSYASISSSVKQIGNKPILCDIISLCKGPLFLIISTVESSSPKIPGYGISVNIVLLIPFIIAMSTSYISKECLSDGSLGSCI